MTSFYRPFIDATAETLVGGEHALDRRGVITAHRNLALICQIVAIDEKHPEIAKDLYDEALVEAGAITRGDIHTDNWPHSVEQLASKLKRGWEETDELVSSIAISNHHEDIAVRSHPSGWGTTTLFG